MKRIRNIAIAAWAIMALTAALGATGAFASEIRVETTPATVSGSGVGNEHKLGFHNVNTSCIAPGLSGSVLDSSQKMELQLKDSTCGSIFVGSNFEANGCSLVLRPGALRTTYFEGSVDIACPTGKTIKLNSTTSGPCVVTIPPQKNLAATYENTGSGKNRSINVNLAAGSITHTLVSGKDCGEYGTFTSGTWVGSWTVQGSSGGSQSGIWLTGSGFELPPAGIAINGATPKLVAGTYPITVSGTQTESGKHSIVLSGGKVSCSSVDFSSTVSAASSQFTVQAAYGGCTAFGFPATVSMNGCSYTFNVLNQAPVGSTYAGHADIACPAGKAIEMVATGTSLKKCTITIGAQTTDSGGLSFTNEANSTIALGLAIKGIDYHQQAGEGLGACATGDFTTGTYTGSSALVGSY